MHQCSRILTVCLTALLVLTAAVPAFAANTADATAPPLIATAPPQTSAPTITLSDLVRVAKCIAGTGTLTETEREQLGLRPEGNITLADLVDLAFRFAAQHADPANAVLPSPDPRYETVAVLGTISSADLDENTWYVRQEDGIETGAILSGETVIVDCTTAEPVDVTALLDGTRVVAYLSLQMMPSEPARAACSALILNPPTVGAGNAAYIYASEVKTGENGAVIILNQNSDLYLTVPQDIPISVLGDPSVSAAPTDIAEGTRLIAWFDVVGLSYPAQAWALRVMIVPG